MSCPTASSPWTSGEASVRGVGVFPSHCLCVDTILMCVHVSCISFSSHTAHTSCGGCLGQQLCQKTNYISCYLCHHCAFKFSICVHQSSVQGGAGERPGVFAGHGGPPPGPGCSRTSGHRNSHLPQNTGQQRDRRPQQEPADSGVRRRIL